MLPAISASSAMRLTLQRPIHGSSTIKSYYDDWPSIRIKSWQQFVRHAATEHERRLVCVSRPVPMRFRTSVLRQTQHIAVGKPDLPACDDARGLSGVIGSRVQDRLLVVHKQRDARWEHT